MLVNRHRDNILGGLQESIADEMGCRKSSGDGRALGLQFTRTTVSGMVTLSQRKNGTDSSYGTLTIW